MRSAFQSHHTALVAALATAVFALTAAAQTAPPPPPAAGGPPPAYHQFPYPKPTNLKVLPKDLTGDQVRQIMHGWAGSLGVHCDTCHAVDPHKIGPNGRPELNFPDDSKPQKSSARLMFKMVQDINGNYISMVTEKPDVKVTCGTCHRGHLDPQPFVIPEENHGGPHAPPGAPAEHQHP